ncbi:hypothetical protein DFQ28_009810 [Apophysomyces sp. BC1034]|nr:hypothetical protein DFQ30_009518 [Apophysomyces sp. BC1015]KAG0181607.1 hypothetical protein DFQ29_007711 [Apophysomyces sp. BC1021]KAG0192236.1 hypothetical protein DFQ28_009810 [Apophysomyces sp. BC1034]
MGKLRNPFKPKRRQFAELQEDPGFSAEQFVVPEPEIPWKAIGLASLLFTIGSVMIAIGTLIKLGYIGEEGWNDRGIPFLVLGSIMFIPGAYHLYIAYYAYYKYPGYDFSMIPDWE